MGCGASNMGKVPSSKRLSSNPLNKMGGHAYNLDKDDMEGVLTLNIGTCKDLNLTSMKKPKNLHVVASFGAQTFKTGNSTATSSCSWDDVCHIWVQEHQLQAKVRDRKFDDLCEFRLSSHMQPKIQCFCMYTPCRP